MAKEDLIPFNKRTEAEQKAIARQGGIASGESRRKKKEWKDILAKIGNLPVKSKKNREIMLGAGLSEEDMISDVQKLYRLNLKADAGDPKAIELIARIRGEFAPIKTQNENYEMEAPAPRLAKDRSEKQ